MNANSLHLPVLLKRQSNVRALCVISIYSTLGLDLQSYQKSENSGSENTANTCKEEDGSAERSRSISGSRKELANIGKKLFGN